MSGYGMCACGAKQPFVGIDKGRGPARVVVRSDCFKPAPAAICWIFGERKLSIESDLSCFAFLFSEWTFPTCEFVVDFV